MNINGIISSCQKSRKGKRKKEGVITGQMDIQDLTESPTMMGEAMVEDLNFSTDKTHDQAGLTPNFTRNWKQQIKSLSTDELRHLIAMQETQNKYDQVYNQRRFQKSFFQSHSNSQPQIKPQKVESRFQKYQQFGQQGNRGGSMIFEKFVDRVKVSQQMPTIMAHEILKKSDQISIRNQKWTSIPQL